MRKETVGKKFLKSLFLGGIFLGVYFINLMLIKKLTFYNFRTLEQKKILTEIYNINQNLQRQFNFSSFPSSNQIISQAEVGDGRVANLKAFFRKYNSPLYDYAELIVKVSDKYGFDYRLLPAIAMQESTLCKYIPENSYNCWGYGIYGDQVIKFSSYEEAIETVARGIKRDYLDKGLTTPELVMKKYTPSSPGTWAKGVSFVFRLLE